MMKPIYTQIQIDAPAEIVWGIIIDSEKYPAWNPFIPRISLTSDQVVVGTEFDLDCQMTDSQLLKNEREVVLEVNRDEYTFRMGTSRTRGRTGIVSNHCQICRAIDANRTQYINYEEFTGILAPLVHMLYSRKLNKAFEKHNMALKLRAENMAQESKGIDS